MKIIELLSQDNYLMYNLNIAKQIGVYEAILIGELARKHNYWAMNDRLTDDGYFFITQDDIEKDTGLTSYQQRQALKHLKELDIIDISKKGGTDRSNYYKVFDDALLKYLTFQGKNPEPSKVKKVNDTNTTITNTINTKIRGEDKNTSVYFNHYSSKKDNYKGRAAFASSSIPVDEDVADAVF